MKTFLRQGGLLIPTIGFLAWAGGGAVHAQAKPDPILHHTFDVTVEAWVAAGENAKASITTDPAQVKEGKGALKYSYTIKKGILSFLSLPTPDHALAKMMAMRFWVKSDYATPLAMVLQEKDGGRYTAGFTVPAGKWQRVELAPSDFILSTDADSPKDPDGKLDMPDVESIALTDQGQFLAQLDNPDLFKLLNGKTGPHTLLLDDFVVSSEILPDNGAGSDGDILLDKFARPQLTWTCVGDINAATTSGKPLDKPGLRADYTQKPGSIIGLFKAIAGKPLLRARSLHLTAASSKFAKLLIQVEETDGGKYNVMLDIKEGGEAKEYVIPFNEMIAAEDSKDTNRTLDLDLINKLLILDLTGFYTQMTQDNTLWISNVRTTAK